MIPIIENGENMKKKALSVNLTNMVYIILLRISLDLSYKFGISKIFISDGFFYEFNCFKFIESYILMSAIYAIIPKSGEKVSSIIIQILFMFIIIPTTSLFAYGSFYETRTPLYLYSLGFILTSLLVRGNQKRQITKIKEGKSLLFIFIFALTALTMGMMFFLNGFPSFTAFNLLNVYEVREATRYNAILNYTLNWQVYVINTFLIAYSVVHKKNNLLLFSIAIQLYLFLVAAHKTYLFSIIMVIGLVWFVDKSKNLIKDMLKILISTNLIVLSMYIFLNNYIPLAIITRRVFFIPAQISYFYFDFFANNQLLLFSEGIIGKIINISSPYNMRVANMIAGVYYNQPNMASNTGYLSDAFANAGVFGVIIISIILGVILRLIESLNIDMRITLAVIIMPIFALVNGALLTTILTNGLLVSVVVLYLYKNHQPHEIGIKML